MKTIYQNNCNFQFSETPSTSPQLVWFKDESYHELTPPSLQLNWDPFNLTMNEAAKVGKRKD